MTKNVFLAFLIALSISIQAETLSGVVVGLADGDTLGRIDYPVFFAIPRRFA
jgi:hypothetical protein